MTVVADALIYDFPMTRKRSMIRPGKMTSCLNSIPFGFRDNNYSLFSLSCHLDEFKFILLQLYRDIFISKRVFLTAESLVS